MSRGEGGGGGATCSAPLDESPAVASVDAAIADVLAEELFARCEVCSAVSRLLYITASVDIFFGSGIPFLTW
jgi:hypothetical protein